MLIFGSAELRKRARQGIGAVVGICVIGYFVYHVIHGDRGLIAWHVLDQDVADARISLASIREERLTLERRVRLLRSASLDRDMLDEWARRVLNYGAANEAVIFTTDEDASFLPEDTEPTGREPGTRPRPHGEEGVLNGRR